MTSNPLTSECVSTDVRVLVQGGKALLPGAEQLIAEKETQPMRPVEKRRFIADFPRTSKKQRQQDREAAKNAPQHDGVPRTTSDTQKIAPTPACARETGIPAKLGNRLRDPEPAVIRRGLENKRAKATRKVAELEIRLEAERVKLAGIVDSLGRL